MVETIKVEVAYATPHKQLIVPLNVEQGCTMFAAAEQALQKKLSQEFPEINFDEMPMGIFGKAERNPKERVLQAGDRVEIYRPLLVDPKEVRKKRAAKAAAEKAKRSE